jgi:membrane-bound ClpP family serine protease
VLGIGAIIAGIVLIILKKHWAVIGITLVGGIVIGALGLVMFLRARSQQYRFKQQLELAKARSGVTTTPAAAPAATTTKTAAAATTT